MIANLYIPNVRALNFIRLTLLDIKGGISTNIIIVGAFNSTRPKNSNFRDKLYYK
jgi:hypothetical protein